MSDTILGEVAGEIKETAKRVPKEVTKISPGEIWKAFLTGETTENVEKLKATEKKKVGREVAKYKSILAQEGKKQELPVYYQKIREEQEKAFRQKAAAEKELPAPKTTAKSKGVPFSTMKIKEGTEGRTKNIISG